MIAAMSGRISSPDLIAREAELAVLHAAFEAAAAGRARTVLLGGEAGLGKTRLVGAAAGLARDRGGRVLMGGCIATAQDSLPFAPIIEAIRPIVRGPGGAGAMPAASDDRPAPDAASSDRIAVAARRIAEDLGLSGTRVRAETVVPRPEWDRTGLYEAILDLLDALGAISPVLFVVEDIHWADGSTRELLAFLARNAHAERLLMLPTFRSDELSRRHPLVPWLAEVGRLPNVERLELGRLDREAVVRQLASILGRAPDGTLVDALFGRSGGNPFFVEELVAAGIDHRGLPPTLGDVLRARLAGLSEGAVTVLGVAAVIGPRVDEDLLDAAAGLPRDAVTSALREAAAAGIIVVDETSGDQRFRHALLAEAASDALLPGERRRLHATIAAALAERAPGRGVVRAVELATIAHHWSEARDLPRALAASVAAGTAAFEASAYSEALRQLDRALEIWDVVPDAEAVAGIGRVAVLQTATQAAIGIADTDRALAHGRAAVALVDPAVDPLTAGLLEERLGRALWASGRLAEAREAYERAVALIPADPPSRERARVLAGLAGNRMVSTLYREAAGPAREALALAVSLGDRSIAGHAMNTLGVCDVYLGDAEGGIARLREALAIARSTPGAVEDVGRAYANLAFATSISGHMAAGVEVSLEGIRVLSELGGGRWVDFVRLNAALDMLNIGRIDEALVLIDEVDPAATGVVRAQLLDAQATAYLTRGDLAAARRAIDAVDGLLVGSDSQFSGPLALERAILVALEGDPARAAAEVEASVPLVERTDGDDRLARLYAAGARFHAEAAVDARARRDATGALTHAGGAAEMADRATRFAEGYSGPVAPAVGAYASLARAEAARAAADPAVDRWRQAIVALDARGYVHYRAYARFRAAEAAFEARSDRAEADGWLRDAHRRALAMGAAPLEHDIRALARRARVELESPAEGGGEEGAAAAATASGLSRTTGRAGAADFGLTPREREVLVLLADGRTNREIGEALFMSESTAGVHVSRILGKLGVASRTEAAAVATRLGLVGDA
jgi:DNA-binding CsgD family transcriptional regulator/tetratricopeptide (TPR) repeat protein